MTKKAYSHSAYWYAYHNGWTYSEAGSYTGRYLDLHSYRPRARKLFGYAGNHSRGSDDWRNGGEGRESEEWDGKGWFKHRYSEKLLDSTFNPLLLGICIAMDIGVAMRDGVRKLTDPAERDRIKRELMHDLRIVRRPFYYARETERRRLLAAERRKVVRRRTTAPMPTPEAILAAWNGRKASREAMLRLGGLLDDLSCHVDSCLRFDADGTVIGRNGGIRGWLSERLPELSPNYKTLMRYKAMALRLRQATNTKDPVPTTALLDEPRPDVVASLLADDEPVFSRLFAALEHLLSPETVLLDTSRKATHPPQRRARRSRTRIRSG